MRFDQTQSAGQCRRPNVPCGAMHDPGAPRTQAERASIDHPPLRPLAGSCRVICPLWRTRSRASFDPQGYSLGRIRARRENPHHDFRNTELAGSVVRAVRPDEWLILPGARAAHEAVSVVSSHRDVWSLLDVSRSAAVSLVQQTHQREVQASRRARACKRVVENTLIFQKFAPGISAWCGFKPRQPSPASRNHGGASELRRRRLPRRSRRRRCDLSPTRAHRMNCSSRGLTWIRKHLPSSP